ncbi:hypothetical protein KIH41_02650 [Litoribacter ruber]|uniref:Uncharacterized protein n=1 Tax=Litoribacter ruber TaxID=702568 RepID=A0AAP2CJ87_9BACT|nr:MULTISPECIES: hypothetical protein [Litoribacter]MBS9525763.1 hypothetical protein [Litoribacter alkaliphilus]MBT0810180.1 hypothetical protein [Litoribacter ruber]
MGMLNYDFDLGFYSKGFSKAQILGFTSKDIERLEAMEGPEIPDKEKEKKEEKKKKDPNSGGPRPPKEEEYRDDDDFPEVSNPNKKD